MNKFLLIPLALLIWCATSRAANPSFQQVTNVPVLRATNLVIVTGITVLDQAQINRVIVSNYAYAASMVLPMRHDMRASVTNALGGNVALLVTNIHDGSVSVTRFTADGSDRTVSMFWPAGTTVKFVSTNASPNATNFAVLAGKVGRLRIECLGTNYVLVDPVLGP